MLDEFKFVGPTERWPDDVKRKAVEIAGREVAIVVTRKAPPGTWFLVSREVADLIAPPEK